MKRFALSALLALAPLASLGAEPRWEELGPRALSDLRSYLRIANVNPPADSQASVAFLKALLEKEGVAVQVFSNGADKQTLLARLPGRRHDAPLLLLHHMDVVPADASRWPVDPFGAVIRDGYLYGRGAVDMKSIGILQLYTFLALKRENAPLEHDLLLMASPDEESGGEKGTAWMCREHWAELQPRYVLDEGGFATRDLLGASGQPVVSVAVAEKKLLWLRITATGTAGHASQPTPDNPNDRLLLVLRRIQELPLRSGQNPILEEMRARLGPLADNKFTRAIGGDTLSVTSLRSGVGDPPKVNVIPSVAQATLDFRLLPDTDTDGMRRSVQAICDAVPGVTMEILHSMQRSPVSDSRTPLFAGLAGAVQTVYPEARITPSLVPFGTDSNTIRLKGVDCYGFNPIRLDASMVASMHSDAERIPVAELEPALRCYYLAVRNYCCSP